MLSGIFIFSIENILSPIIQLLPGTSITVAS
jgi:hypothetical protein